MGRTNIEWCDRVWNPVRGCTRVSPGCQNCYAERQAVRQSGPGKPYEGLVRSTPNGPRWTGKVQLVASVLLEPLSWRKPCRVFVNSMSDLFHEGLTDVEIDWAFAVMALAERHTFQVLTKRPERMLAYMKARGLPARWAAAVAATGGKRSAAVAEGLAGGWRAPLHNVWLGVSVEDQQRADERIPPLLQTPAAVLFVSVEPLLGPVDFDEVPLDDRCYGTLGTGGGLPGIDWVIVGGESGPGARPCDVAWIRSVVQQCRDARVPCFVKQLGSKPRTDHRTRLPEDDWVKLSTLDDRKGGDPAEWPGDLRVREFPEARA